MVVAAVERADETAGQRPARNRLVSIEVARGLAALSVLVFHVAQTTGHAYTAGSTGPLDRFFATLANGVAVFFAITGFVIGAPIIRALVQRRPWSASTYALRRLGRIVPAYWVVLVFLLVVPSAGRPFTDGVWRYFGFMQIYSAHPVDGLAPAWTLAVEMSFYVLLPLLALGVGRRLLKNASPERVVNVLLAILVVTGAASLTALQWRFALPIGSSAQQWLKVTMIVCWVLFTPGLLVAVVAAAPVRHPVAKAGRAALAARWFAAASIACLILGVLISAWAVGASGAAFQVGVQLGALLMGAGALALAFSQRHRSVSDRWAALPLLGTISYGVYLWHFPVMSLARNAFGVDDETGLLASAAFLVPVAAGAVLAATLSWHLVEKPLKNLTHRAR